MHDQTELTQRTLEEHVAHASVPISSSDSELEGDDCNAAISVPQPAKDYDNGEPLVIIRSSFSFQSKSVTITRNGEFLSCGAHAKNNSCQM